MRSRRGRWRERQETGGEPGAEPRVVCGGFSSEPSCEIRASVAAFPLIKQNRAADLTAAAPN